MVGMEGLIEKHGLEVTLSTSHVLSFELQYFQLNTGDSDFYMWDYWED